MKKMFDERKAYDQELRDKAAARYNAMSIYGAEKTDTAASIIPDISAVPKKRGRPKRANI